MLSRGRGLAANFSEMGLALGPIWLDYKPCNSGTNITPEAPFPHGAAALYYKQFGFAMKERAARERQVHGCWKAFLQPVRASLASSLVRQCWRSPFVGACQLVYFGFLVNTLTFMASIVPYVSGSCHLQWSFPRVTILAVLSGHEKRKN